MTKKERILRTLNFEKTDRVALLGGFLVSSRHYQHLASVSAESFQQDPVRHAVSAYRKLDVDGLILLRLPTGLPGHLDYRGITREAFDSTHEIYKSAEDVLRYVDSLPSPEQAFRDFDPEGYRSELIKDITSMQQQLGDIVWLPTQWDLVHPTFEWFNVFGYQNYMEFLGLYPEPTDRLFGAEVDVKRCISSIVAEVYQQLDMVPLVHIGTDICGSKGPVVSPEYLRMYYWPHVKRTLEPLHEAGFKTVWHSDGVITPIIDDLLDCGVSGFQGFQWEYGIKLEDIVKKRTKDDERLTIFAGPSVTSTLPNGTIKQVQEEIEYIINTARDNCALFILPANDVLPDVPPESLIALYEHAARQ